MVGDGEAETGPLEGSWKGTSFINPARDGARAPYPAPHGYKTAGPTVLGRKDPALVRSLPEGHGYRVLEVEGDDVPGMHHRFCEALLEAHALIGEIPRAARQHGAPVDPPKWPMIVLRIPKGWTGPQEIDGIEVTGSWRSHQVPLSGVKGSPEHLAALERWLRSYKPEELLDDSGAPVELVRKADPTGQRRSSASPHANGGLLSEDLDLPDFPRLSGRVDQSWHGGGVRPSARRDDGGDLPAQPPQLPAVLPDETNSNRLGAVFDVSDRAFMEKILPADTKISHEGRVMEVLSEHNCHGWLEGYTLTGRHGLFATYESFAMVSASQTIQHSKWLEEGNHLAWRAKVPSLNILLTSTCWRNDHNGFSHQGPGLIQNVITQRADVCRVYLPPDANTLLSVADHCLRSRSYVNLIVIDKQPQQQWLSMDEAVKHCADGAGIWAWAGTDDFDTDPDIVLASARDVVTMENVAAAEILKEKLPGSRSVWSTWST